MKSNIRHMRKHMLPFTLFIFFAAIFSNYSFPQGTTSTFTLEVRVTDYYDNPIEEAILFINHDFASETLTADNGIAVYTLPAGTYLLSSYAPNYLDYLANITITDSDVRYHIRHAEAIHWSTAPANAPVGVGEKNGVRMAAAGENIYLWAAYGGQPGFNQYAGLTDFYKYNTGNDTWSKLPDAPFSSSYGISTAWGKNVHQEDAIYIIKGYWSGQRTWFARFNISSGQWENGLDHNIPWNYELGNQFNGTNFQNYPRNGSTMVYGSDHHIYLFPGSSYNYEKYDWYRYSVDTNRWEAMQALPHRQGPGNAAVWVDGSSGGLDQDYIYVQFGITPSGNYTAAEFWRYGVSTGTWDNLADHAYGADDGSMLVWDGEDYIFHSPGAWAEQTWDKANTQKRQFMRYSISANAWEEMEKTPYNRWGGWDDAGGMVIVGNTIYAMKGGDDVAWADGFVVSGGGDIPNNQLWKYTIFPGKHQLKVMKTSGNGSVSLPEGNQYFEQGTNLEVFATPLSGWEFDKWIINEDTYCGKNPTPLVMDEDKTIKAVFIESPTTLSELKISPPVVSARDGLLYVHLPEKEGWLSVYDLMGRKMQNPRLLNAGNHVLSFDYAPGIYITRLVYGNHVLSAKVPLGR